MVYERGDGYFNGPRGKRYPLHDRPEDQLVPVAEIEMLLVHLGFSTDGFWQFPSDLERQVERPDRSVPHSGKDKAVGVIKRVQGQSILPQ